MDEDTEQAEFIAHPAISHGVSLRSDAGPFVAVNETMKPTLYNFLPNAHGASVLVTPVGFQTHSLQGYADAYERSLMEPRRRKGTYVAASIESLLRWMDAHTATAAPVFAVGAENLAGNWALPNLSLLGIGNYSSAGDAEWHDFQVAYRFPVTRQWTSWAASNNEWMTQAEFSEFVEGHLYEFSEPKGEKLSEASTRMIEALGGGAGVGSPKKMYEVANGIKIMVSESVEVDLDRSSGEQTLKFTETHTGKGGRPISIPKFFFIRVPIFFGEAESLVGVLLRYRNIGGGRVNWSYELFAPDLVVKDAFDKACNVVSGQRTLYLGSPDCQSGTYGGRTT